MSIGKDSVKSQWKHIYILDCHIDNWLRFVELGKPENIEDWLEKYSYDEEAVERIKDYLTRNKVAMPIFSFQEIEPIDMRRMEKDISGFRVPISYMFLDDKPELLKYIDLRTKYKNKRIEHDFTHISSKDICVC